MLSPFKTFLNNLQKNAGATIFGLSAEDREASADSYMPSTTTSDTAETNAETINDQMSAAVTCDEHIASPYPDEPVIFHSADDQCSQQSCDDDDPLSDPLALDDCCSTNEPYDRNLLTAADDVLTTTELTPNVAQQLGAATDIILVDVNRLKSASPLNVADEDDGGGNFAAVTSEMAEVEEGGVRSDGSDSGLGLERPNPLIVESHVRPVVAAILPLRTNLKRRSDSLMLDDGIDGSSSSSPDIRSSIIKRPKRNITFTDVTVFYFQRMQGFMCVPSQGGCTLGMAATHMHQRRFASLAEHAAEQRRAHRHKLQEQKRLNGLPVSSSDDTETDDDDGPSENSGGSDTEADASSVFLQTVSPRQRRVLLKAAGVWKIDATEKDECRVIRLSREVCGCNCRGFCDPDTCACAQSGIKCQVDRVNYPCGCTHDGCGNAVGRVEFNSARVRTHHIHTLLRLDLESKQQESIQHHHLAAAFDQTINPPSSLLGWHSHMGRSLAASSANSSASASAAVLPSIGAFVEPPDATALMDTNCVVVRGGFMEPPNMLLDDGHLHLVQTNHLPSMSALASAGPTIAHLAPQIVRTALSPTLDLHFTYRDDLATTNLHKLDGCAVAVGLDVIANHTSSTLATTNIVHNYMPLIYSPDSAAIVEPSTTPSDALSGIAKVPPSCPAYATDYGNMTGYQHSYLYSLQQHSPKTAATLDLNDDDIFGACAVVLDDDEHHRPPTNGTEDESSGCATKMGPMQSLLLDPDGSQTSGDECVDFRFDGAAKEFDAVLEEPIDFENEVGLNASVISKATMLSCDTRAKTGMNSEKEFDGYTLHRPTEEDAQAAAHVDNALPVVTSQHTDSIDPIEIIPTKDRAESY